MSLCYEQPPNDEESRVKQKDKFKALWEEAMCEIRSKSVKQRIQSSNEKKHKRPLC